MVVGGVEILHAGGAQASYAGRIQRLPQGVLQQAVFDDPAQCGTAFVGRIEIQGSTVGCIPHMHVSVSLCPRITNVFPDAQVAEQGDRGWCQSHDTQIDVVLRMPGRRFACLDQGHGQIGPCQRQGRGGTDHAATDDGNVGHGAASASARAGAGWGNGHGIHDSVSSTSRGGWPRKPMPRLAMA